MKKIREFFGRAVWVVIPLLVLFSCGGLSYLIWQALGTTIQQIILATAAIGFVWNCLLPLFTVLVILGLVFLGYWLMDKYNWDF